MNPKETLETMLGFLGFMVEIQEQEGVEGQILQVYTAESERLIGRHGETLEDLQFLLNRVLQNREKTSPRVIVDVEHHRAMRNDALIARIRQLAETVRQTGRPVQLEPMNSYDRRLVHNAFANDPVVSTWSPPDEARIKRITLQKRSAAR